MSKAVRYPPNNPRYPHFWRYSPRWLVDYVLKKKCIYFAIGALQIVTASARTWYVDAVSGNDQNSGTSAQASFRSIQHAADQTEAGDIVLVLPGVYFESVKITKRGSEENPLTFRAADGKEGAVIITGADRKIRENAVQWEIVSARDGIFRIPCLRGWPARVLADGLDLYPYSTLDSLTQFKTHAGLGPKRGYTYDPEEQMLYIRLHQEASGEYPDPNNHLICVAPPTGGGFDGTLITKPSEYCFGIIGHAPAHVLLEGFTFETPGVAGVYTEASHVKVADSWFAGCRTGVSGNYHEDFYDESVGPDEYFNLRHTEEATECAASDVVVEHCNFTQKPTMEDTQELIAAVSSWPDDRKERFSIMWHRKTQAYGLPSDKFKYEIGVVCRGGKNWIIRRNRIDDAFEGLSSHSVSGSVNMSVVENIFSNIADNAVETEDHSQGMQITGNVMIDCMEAVSFQPLRGLPWPGSITVKNNVIVSRFKDAFAWPKELISRAAFKIGVSQDNWTRPQLAMAMAEQPHSPIRLPGSGMLIEDNVVIMPGGSSCKVIGKGKTVYENVFFKGNLLIAESLVPADQKLFADTFQFSDNIVFEPADKTTEAEAIVAGNGNIVIDEPPSAYLESTPTLAEQFHLLPKNDSEETLQVLNGYFVKLPSVGPRKRTFMEPGS